MKTGKKRIIISAVACIAALCIWVVWERTASATRIALVNFQPFQTSSIVKSNDDPFVRYDAVPLEETAKLGRYDFMLAFGMGLQMTVEQRAAIREMADRGLPVYVYGATSPENNICNLDSADMQCIGDYLNHGNKRNYRSLARYVRQRIDGKRFFVNAPDTAFRSASDVLYHLDENVAFAQVADYEAYLKENGFYTPSAPRIAVVGGLNDPFGGNRDNIDSLIVALQRDGMNVYPVLSFMKRLDFLRDIQPDAVIYFAHGRMVMGQADEAVEWLKARNIPVFAPLSLLQTKEEWEADAMGMFGGFMSQSIVMPELDGAIYPYVLNVQETDRDGLYLFKAIPERLHTFTQIVKNFVALKQKRNADKKIAVYYFKGAGQSTLAAQGLETVPALYNFLKRLQAEGYRVDGLPADVRSFEKLLMTQGAVLSPYAEGAFDDFIAHGQPATVEKAEYESWVARSLPEALYDDVVRAYGEAPGSYMAVRQDDRDFIAVARIRLGNIALLPQPMAGTGSDAFAVVHGTRSAPPHPYIASYLWTQHDFKADAILHFGTHGSLEFTPQKQVALSGNDWPDCLVGAVPHFYYYTIGNVGESMMAKRRAYAATVSYLTPPFTESRMRGQFKALQDKIRALHAAAENRRPAAALEVKKIAVAMGLHRDLRLDSALTVPYSDDDVARIENFAEEIANEKMTGQLYTSGVPYDDAKIRSTVLAVSADPIAYGLAALDRLRGTVDDEQLKNKPLFTQNYLVPAQQLVGRILDGVRADDELICAVARITPDELREAKTILAPVRRAMPSGMSAGSAPSASTGAAGGKKPSSGGGHPSWIPKIGKRPAETTSSAPATPDTAKTTPAMPPAVPQPPAYTAEQKARARAVSEVERAVRYVTACKKALEESPEQELRSLLNALAGGYVAPSSGGDAVANPNALPTGRNLYAVNAEATPSETAWDKGVALVDALLEQYKKQHGDYPRKVSYTFWSSEFIESEGVTVAQALYMLGVEPVRDSYGRVSDLQLIPSSRLARPRIDIVVQTSGQFRDLAASRLALISRAVEMAASAGDDDAGNFVAAGAVDTERLLVEQGVPPKAAREMSLHRIFGGVNGMYGTNIQGMVTAGDRWETEQEIADTYIRNMGAVYGSDKSWGQYHDGLLRAVLRHTDVVVQPRQSNTWGALSLDHVYEFMGGLNLAVRQVTGKDPDAWFADYRNRNHVRMQELKEAIGVEARATVFNPAYIREVMKGNASSAAQITEVVTNTYGWNVMKPDVIDREMWDKLYDVYVKDEYALGTEDFFRRENPFALQEITAVMLETARKGMWQAGEQQLRDIADLHVRLVDEFGPSASGFSGGNARLQDFIARNADPQAAGEYRQQLRKMQTSAPDDDTQRGLTLKKDGDAQPGDDGKGVPNGAYIVPAILVLFVVLLALLRKKRKG
ncbi:MAG: cobaltochelatase subunit CobN [Tannerella sp.]|jgi:cobaltochelatase CobN|nr:cobaltochelatase subunit CobN [Tannerella sp.]